MSLTFLLDMEIKTVDEEISQTLHGPPLPKETSSLPSELQDNEPDYKGPSSKIKWVNRTSLFFLLKNLFFLVAFSYKVKSL